MVVDRQRALGPLQRQPGLARAADADQCEQPRRLHMP